ncbi:MAG: hypothetical protein H0V70_16005 [Ktedonobacteraceae bacterium]|nr:hypothetical protein [Ktedonobacteraceae bacterium]
MDQQDQVTINEEYCWMHEPGGWTCAECRDRTSERVLPMKQSLAKWLSIVCLCLVLLALPALLGACGFEGKINMGASFPLGSSHNPYTISATPGLCTTWRVTLDGVSGKPWCASTVPTFMHPGDYVHLSYGVLFQSFCVSSIDATQHHISLGSIG